MSTFCPGDGCSKAEVVANNEINLITLETARTEGWPFCLQTSNMTIYDSQNCMLSFEKALKDPQFGGQEDHSGWEKVGPIKSWETWEASIVKQINDTFSIYTFYMHDKINTSRTYTALYFYTAPFLNWSTNSLIQTAYLINWSTN